MNNAPAGLPVLACRPRDTTQAAEENVCHNRAVMVKGKVVPMLVIKAYGGVEVQLHSL